MDLCELSATEAAAALRRGDFSAERYAAALLDRCRRLGRLNAFLTLGTETLLESARRADRDRAAGAPLGRLHGLPLAIKDNIDVAGLPTSCNSPQLATQISATDSALVRRLKTEGGLVIGKANMHELALGSPNDPAAGGDAVNPYAPDFVTGGSSSGTAVAVAARMAPGGLGTDTGGSIRIPAAHCGIAGLRPTLGRYAGEGIAAFCPTRDTAGPMARTVADVALMDAAICDTEIAPPSALHRLRLGVPRRYFYEMLDPVTAAFAETELARLRDHGVALVEADIDDIERLNEAVSFVVFLYEAPRGLAAYLAERLPGVAPEAFARGIASPGCRELVTGLLGAPDSAFPPVSEQAYKAAITTWRPALREAYRRYFARHNVDAIVFPTTPLPARPLAPARIASLKGVPLNKVLIYLRLIDPSSNAGLPGLTVPAALTNDGVPMGLAFDAPEGRDAALLALGAAYEAILPPFPAPPLPE